MSESPRVVFFAAPSEMRAWLAEHHRTARELWVGFYRKGTGKLSLTWPEAVQEALCFGWIDGIRRGLDEESYTNRFTPRKPRSNWSLINIDLAKKLIEEGRMAASGLEAFEARSEARSSIYTYERKDLSIDPDFERKLKKNRAAWRFFQAQPPWYRRTTSRWVMSAKRDETRLRRLDALIEDSAAGRTIGLLTRKKKTKKK